MSMATASDGVAKTGQAEAVVASVRQAAVAWASLPVAERVAKLRAAAQAVLADAEQLAQLVHTETRKPLAEAYSADVLGVADVFGYWCKHGPAALKPRKGLIPKLEMPGKSALVERLPRGVVAIISPWNFPVALPTRTLVPALLAGNGVVLKPSEFTPRTGAWLAAKLRSVLGGVVDVLEGDGVMGAALVTARPDLVHFTGSTATGRKVAVACAELGIPCEQELGGKDCAIVRADVDVARAAAGIAWGILSNAGQNCAGIERVAVHAAVADRFIPALVGELERAAPHVPHLVTSQQRAIVQAHIREAVAAGGRLLTGGAGVDDQPIPPTLVADVPTTCRAWTDETFGPVALLAVGADDEALLALANDARYGLGGSVWSRDLVAAEALGRRLQVGMVWLNNHSFSGALPDLPWVGTGQSGTGLTSSPEVIHHLTRPRLLLTDRSEAIEPWWYPYGDAMVELMRRLVERHRTGGLGATWRVLGALRARNQELRAQNPNQENRG
jgi:acyl-CoA reductase-like NAD-dependent aldehyde dehydrogenase